MSVENTSTEISSTEFRAHSGLYIDESGKKPVYITKHGRRVRVLVDYEEFERLKARDEMRTYRTEDLPDDIKAEFETGYQGEPTPHLDHLMD